MRRSIPFFSHGIDDYFGDSLRLLWDIDEWASFLNGIDDYIGDFKVFKLLLKQSLFLDSRSVVSVGDDLVAI